MKNKFRVTRDVLTLQAKRKGKSYYIHLDLNDYANVANFRWYINGNGYAIASFPKELGSWKNKILIHRLLLGCPSGMHVDHKNHNKLDNRRSNLRICNRNQNQGNSRKQSNNTTGYKGVFKNPRGRYYAQIRVEKSIHLGTFDTPEEAARVYNEAALKEWGEFAHLNEV